MCENFVNMSFHVVNESICSWYSRSSCLTINFFQTSTSHLCPGHDATPVSLQFPSLYPTVRIAMWSVLGSTECRQKIQYTLPFSPGVVNFHVGCQAPWVEALCHYSWLYFFPSLFENKNRLERGVTVRWSWTRRSGRTQRHCYKWWPNDLIRWWVSWGCLG